MTKKKKKEGGKKSKITPELVKGILSLLREHPTQSFSLKKLYKKFEITSRVARIELEGALEALVGKNLIELTGDNEFKAFLQTTYFTGIVDHVNPSYCFVVVEGLEQDIRVSSGKMKKAFDGDKVTVKAYDPGSGRRMEGEVIEIVERSRLEFAGHIDINERFAFVVPSHRKLFVDFFIPKDEINGAKRGDKVIVQMIGWPEREKNPIAKVVRILGKSGDNDTEIHSIMFEYGLPYEFTKEVEDEANQLKPGFTKKELSSRKDFRGITTFTIDPENAKDFDDALSVRKLDNGHWEVGVHIADVTHYVKPDTALEAEARQRATSVYLVDRTVPMLPEHISNGLCSLNPHEDKLTFAAVFELDENADIVKEWFGKTVIHSDRRFTYEQAQEVLETGKGDFADELLSINVLAKKLKERRFNEGAISFESVEVYFKLDEKGKPLGVFPKVRKDAHKLIEEFMLLANKRVAEFVYAMKENGEPKTMVYRVHDEPNPEKVTQLMFFVKKFGHKIDIKINLLAASLNRLAGDILGKPEQNIIESQAIRTMAKAKYTTTPAGHYGLAFRHYTHFTSPIRRYPDMMSHRLLQHYLHKGGSAEKAEFELLCKHSSDMEKRAAEAERASIKYKQAEFMQQFIGKTMKGMITGVTEWGMFVEVEEYKCEGMVRLSNIKGDMYYFDEERQSVIGKKSGNELMLGDRVQIRVIGTNLEKRTIDMDLIIR